MKTKQLKKHIPFLCILLLLSATVVCANEYSGLWVGKATLTHVNEVSIPLDENNDAIAPDPNVPTSTHDAAHLRLILHVDGAGQVNLLKDVAILRRHVDGETESQLFSSEDDLALVSDERLYSDFPVQEARRFASAVFDFGDYKATEALDSIVDEMVSQVTANVWTSDVTSASSSAELRLAEDDAQAAAENSIAANGLVDAADAASGFDQFMINQLPPLTVEDISVTGTVPTNTQNTADELTSTFYEDTRAQDVLDEITAVSTNLSFTTDDEKKEEGLFIAARYADTDNLYQRFVTGSAFGDMIPSAAAAAAAEAVLSNSTPESVSNEVHALTEVSSVESEAFSAQISTYSDTTASDAVSSVLDAVIDAAASSSNDTESAIAAEAEEAGLAALSSIRHFSLPICTPTADYTTFVRSDEFTAKIPDAAEEAAVAAVAEMRDNPFATTNSLAAAAEIAARNTLRSVYILAAKARRTELPMVGMFGPGQGDPRLTADAGTLGTAGLTGEIRLPATHPTNPFRHAQHPDHTAGMDITRSIRLDFDEDASPSSRGMDRLTGIYREEVFGLHKKLGPNQDTGLKVEGTFELNRVSHIDTLNAQ